MNQAKERIPVLIECQEWKIEGLDQISEEFEKKFKLTKEMLGHTGNVRHRGKH